MSLQPYAHLPAGNVADYIFQWDDAKPWTGPGVIQVIPDGTGVRAGWVWDGIIWHSPDEAPMEIELWRATTIIAIDAETARRFAAGFDFRGVNISGSQNSQLTILGAVVGSSGIAFPITWSSRDDTNAVTLNDVSDLQQLFGTCLVWVQTIKGTGVAIKRAIEAAATNEEVTVIAARYLAGQ